MGCWIGIGLKVGCNKEKKRRELKLKDMYGVVGVGDKVERERYGIGNKVNGRRMKGREQREVLW